MFRRLLVADAKSPEAPLIYGLPKVDAESVDRDWKSHRGGWREFSVYTDGPLCKVEKQDRSKKGEEYAPEKFRGQFRAYVDCLVPYRMLGKLHGP